MKRNFLNESRLQSLLKITQYKAENIQQLLDYSLDEAIMLTSSKIGYIYHYDEQKRIFTLNSWSKDVMKDCRITEPQTVYELDKTGIWGEAVRKREPIIVNDFKSNNPLKKEYPEGHVELRSFLTIPIFRGDVIVGVIGVANKETQYNQVDVLQLSLLMDSVWKVVDRKQSEEALKQSELRYRALIEASPIAVVLIRDWRLIFANSAHLKMFGYDSLEEVIGHNMLEYISPKMRDFIRNIHMARLNNGVVPNKYEALGVRKSGAEFFFEISATMVELQDGPATLIFMTDVTERRHNEKMLQESEERFRISFERSTVGKSLTAPDGRIIKANQAFAEIVGYSKEELQNLTFASVTHPDDLSESIECVRKLTANEKQTYRLEKRYLHKNGSIVWADVGTTLIRDNNDQPLYLITSISNITDRKSAEEQILHLNRILRAIRDVNQLIVREKDPMKVIKETCKLLVDYRGYSGAFIILIDKSGKPCGYAQAGMEEVFRSIEEELKRGVLPPCCADTSLEKRICRIMNRSKACVSCPVADFWPEHEIMSIPLKHDGMIYGVLTVIIGQHTGIDDEEQALFIEVAGDISFALHSIAQEKTILMAEKNREHVEAQLRQAQKMEAVGRLAGGVAHDFNNMLNVILGYSTMALERLDTKDPLYQDMKEIELAARRSADLTQQLLTFSRKQIVKPQIINLNTAVAGQKKMLDRLIGEDVEINFTPNKNLWNILIDPSQIDQVLANLATNSRDAISGVGFITIETDNVSMTDILPQKGINITTGDYVMLSFSDNGIGMSEETQERLFEPFFTTKESGKGTGLGLATIYGIVKQNNGFIAVYSNPGVGTTIKIYLPRFQGQTESIAQKPEITSITGTETILIVEDEIQMLNLAKAMLENFGYKALATSSPDDAWSICESYAGEIHLLLTDVIMPGMNGRELKERIDKIKPGIKTLYMSGYTANIITHRGFLENGVELIQKPFSSDVLARKVREILDKS